MPWTKARSRFCVAFEEDETSEPAKEDLEDVLWMTPESSHTIREKDYLRLGVKIDPILYWLYFSFTRQYCSKVRFFCSMKYLQRNASKFAIFFGIRKPMYVFLVLVKDLFTTNQNIISQYIATYEFVLSF